MVEQADTRDLKSLDPLTIVPVRFRSAAPKQFVKSFFLQTVFLFIYVDILFDIKEGIYFFIKLYPFFIDQSNKFKVNAKSKLSGFKVALSRASGPHPALPKPCCL